MQLLFNIKLRVKFNLIKISVIKNKVLCLILDVSIILVSR